MDEESQIKKLISLMARLRDPEEGCPWDLEQDFASVAPYTIEEAYEVADAIERGELGELKDELGDLLFQVVFHARMAEEESLFNFDDVVEAVVTKMIRRHPHVFGNATVNSVAEQSEEWERLKREERTKGKVESSLLDGITRALPALSRAEKLQRRTARVGFDWENIDGVIGKIEEELAELKEALAHGDASGSRVPEHKEAGGGTTDGDVAEGWVGAMKDRERATIEDELGDLLFSCVNLARHLKIDGEQALRRSSQKFEKRFRAMERRAGTMGTQLDNLSSTEQEQLWREIKEEE